MTNDPNRDAYLQIVEQRSGLEGRFTDIRRLDPTGGNGNFSLMFTAEDSQTRERVALKFFHPDKRNDPYRWECFKREAELLSMFTGQRDIIELFYPRSEFVENLRAGNLTIQVRFSFYGLELAASDVGVISAMGAWDAEKILCAFQAMCRAVQRIHSQEVTHRDLTPRNFLVSQSGDIKLSDFGAARRLSDPIGQLLTNYSSFVPGDLRYVAPELMASLHDDDPWIAIRADIFSLGAIFFEMFTGLTLLQLVLDAAALNDLSFMMNNVRRGQRRRVYDGFVSTLASSHPLPDIAAMGAFVPPCIRERIGSLYKAMAAIDYRARLCDFERIFLQIQSCLLVLRNEEKYQRWREEKRKRRLIALAKAQRTGVSK